MWNMPTDLLGMISEANDDVTCQCRFTEIAIVYGHATLSFKNGLEVPKWNPQGNTKERAVTAVTGFSKAPVTWCVTVSLHPFFRIAGRAEPAKTRMSTGPTQNLFVRTHPFRHLE